MRTPIPLSTRPSGLLPADLRVELDSFLLSLEAENLAPKTRRTYGEAVELLGRFLAERGMPTEARSIRREHVEAFVADQVARWRPNTARNRYLALKRFFDWLAEEGLIDTSPMARTRPPRVPEQPVPIVTDDAVRSLLRACEGRSFIDRRDAALIRLLLRATVPQPM
jgi:site-specific recombinase XerD